MYSLEMFGRMFSDGVRHQAYSAALERTVTPDSVVLDIGTGIGVYAMAAARMGARKVYAVEVNPMVRLGPELARINGLDDRIEFIEAMSTDITLPEQADVVVSDLRGLLPLLGANIPSVRDAARRHLAPGGVLMPTRDRLMAAVVSNRKAARWVRDVWLDNPFGLDLSPLVRTAANQVRREPSAATDVLSEPVEVGIIDYQSEAVRTDIRFSDATRIVESGVADGVAMWFEATVIEGISYATGPLDPPTIYGMAFLPFAEPVEVAVGVDFQFEFRAELVDDYVFWWGGSTIDIHGRGWSASHSTLEAAPLDLAAIANRRASHRPGGTPSMLVESAALEALCGGASLGEAAQVLVDTFADRFPTSSGALTYVADLAERHGP